MHFISSFIQLLVPCWKVICMVISLFLHVLDDLGEFHTKSLFWVFNFWEAENLLFLVFNVSAATGTQMEKRKLHSWYFIRRITEGRRPKREEPRGPKQGAHTARFSGRVGPTKISLGHFLARGFLTQDRLAEKVTP